MMLQPEQVEQIRMLLRTSAWNDVMRPVLANRASVAIKQLVLTPAERSGEYKDMDDQAIRMRIRELEWMITCWQNEIQVHDHNRALDELDAQAVNGHTANP